MIARTLLALAFALVCAFTSADARPAGDDGVGAALARALEAAGVGERLRVESRQRAQLRRLESLGGTGYDVEIVDFDPTSRRFAALVGPSDGEDGERVHLSGRAYEMIALPVLRRSVPRGRELTRADLEWRDFRLDRIGADVVEGKDDVAGMVAARRLAAGRPLRARDLTRAVMVAKGAVVTMVLDVPGISLGTLGRALRPGAEGDLIPVMNLRSKRTVEARVSAPDRVRVPRRAGLAIR